MGWGKFFGMIFKAKRLCQLINIEPTKSGDTIADMEAVGPPGTDTATKIDPALVIDGPFAPTRFVEDGWGMMWGGSFDSGIKVRVAPVSGIAVMY
jgi:hypothetical protein